MSDKKYFGKNTAPSCAVCVHVRHLSGGKELFCIKRGPRDHGDCCRSYKYDPLKRDPAKSDFGRDYAPEDFQL